MDARSARELPLFGRRFLDGDGEISRIGSGELGGKGTGLTLIRDTILPSLDPEVTEGFSVRVPSMIVLTTDVFDAFMAANDLYGVACSDEPDHRIAHAFQRAQIPPLFVGDLRALISAVTQPLAVRSSSLLEDALDHPFAGVYGTKMIPNNEPGVDARFARFIAAIKFVWASTFFGESTAYMRAIGRDVRDEKMAVVVQEVIGRRMSDRFYPAISGVGRSFNFYPSGPSRPEEGVISLALGLGKTIVDGGASWTYSPEAPKAPPPFNDMGDMLKNTQTEFWAVKMGPPPIPDPIRETECLVQSPLPEAESDGVLRHLVSTYDQGSDRLYPGLEGNGPRVLNFAPLLGSPLMPFNTVFKHLVDVAARELGTAAEIEFAVDLDPRSPLPATVGFLQLRPMRLAGGDVEVDPGEMHGEAVLLASENVLGNGRRDDIHDIVYLKPASFDTSATQVIAREIDSINERLTGRRRPYLLIGFGRWGTSDPSCGVPVAWGQISGACAIVEATLEGVQPDLSQGSHFFHNMLCFRVLYISIEHHDRFAIDWEWLDGVTAEEETEYVRHVRTSEPLSIRVDGAHRRGVVHHNV